MSHYRNFAGRIYGTLAPVALLSLLLVVPIACQKKQERIQILVSPKGLTHSFWVTVKAGADSAGREIGADIIWKGPAQETAIAEQVAIVEDYINRGVQAIVIAATDSRALIPVLEKARARGIVVVTIDSGIESDLPASYIATNNVAAGEKAAEILAELTDSQGQVALLPFVPGAVSSIEREKGFRQGLARFPDMELVAVQYTQSDVATAMAVTEDILTAHTELAGIFAANEAGAIGASGAILARQLTDQVSLVAFDASPNEIDALESGVIDALVVQDPFLMGYLGVVTARMALDKEKPDPQFDTGVYIITRGNMNDSEIRRILYPLGEPAQ
ncbi:ABC transporter substrate-binding protein [candidate division KSB1 bacterium]